MLFDRIIKLVKLDPRTLVQVHLFDPLHGRVECRKGPEHLVRIFKMYLKGAGAQLVEDTIEGFT